jgi:spermidine synthase
MVAHGELYRLRPPPARLTSFYLAISAGGALGGLFVALVAPRLFVGYYELPLAVGLTVVGVIVVAWRSHRFARERVALALATACALVAFGLFLSHREGPGTRILSAERNFFGVLRVIEKGQPGSHRWVRVLRHGTTLHGRQFQLDKGRAQPTSYYGRATGIGLLVERRGQHGPLHIGVIGLGVGTMAAYGREDDRITFYELDSDVVHIARDAGYFSYLSDSRADIEVVLGDARLSLEREVTRRFDVLVLDAFSSDAVPTHLLTREAFELYARHISEDGVLAAHVSNKHLDLTPLVAKLGLTVGMSALAVETDHMPNLWTGRSQWVLLARDPKILADLQRFVQRQAAVLGSRKLWIRPITSQMLHSAPLWTDDYSNLFELVKTRFSFSIR